MCWSVFLLSGGQSEAFLFALFLNNLMADFKKNPEKYLLANTDVHIIFWCTVKPVLENTCIRQSTALSDHCSDTTALLNST